MYSLDELISMMRSDIVEPNEMLGLQEQQWAAQRERKQAKRAERQTMLDTLGQTAMSGASEGMSLESIIPLLQAQATFSGSPGVANSPRLSQGLESLYDASTGQSLVGSQGLDAEDQAVISNMVFDAMANRSGNPDANTSLMGIRQSIVGRLPEEYMSYIPDIDALISKAYTSASKGLDLNG